MRSAERLVDAEVVPGMESDLNFPFPLNKDLTISFVCKFAQSIPFLLNFISAIDILDSLAILENGGDGEDISPIIGELEGQGEGSMSMTLTIFPHLSIRWHILT